MQVQGTRSAGALLGLRRAPARITAAGLRMLDRTEQVMDHSETAGSVGAIRIRKALAVICAGYALVLSVRTVVSGDLPSPAVAIMLMLAAALFTNRGGRFVRDWVPVALGLFAYALAGSFSAALDLKTSVHYTAQIDADRALGLGSVPTVWLQHHLYNGRTGPLEVVSLAFYASHFVAVLLFAFYIWWRGERTAFATLFFSVLLASLVAMVTFVLVPTAPPWLAAREGYLPGIAHINKQTIDSLGFSSWASWYGNAKAYNIVAAVPSLHMTFPIIGLLVCRRFSLGRVPTIALACEALGVVFSIVYTGEHYVIDAVVGAAYAMAAVAVVSRMLASPSGARPPAPEAPLGSAVAVAAAEQR
jgi:PAP2 superfamily